MYQQLAIALEHSEFMQLQKSDWHWEDTDALMMYYMMLGLQNIPPLGRLQSTVKGLKMHQINDWVFDVTADIQLGGQYATMLEGHTPSGLVPPTIPCVEPTAVNFRVPKYTCPSPAAHNTVNWRV
ncbi:hypothetical protein J3A83DRAFT_4087190 [Scleroderma citrinum]